MPHLEEQFPPVNPLVLQRPDALDPPDREEEENNRTENRVVDETPLPGSLADGIDRVTISANARVIAPVLPLEETTPVTDEVIGTGIQDFVNEIEDNRVSNDATTQVDRNPAEPLIAPVFAPATPPAQTAERATPAVSRIENRTATEPLPVNNVAQNEDPAPRSGNRFAPTFSGPRDPRPETPDNRIATEPAEDVPLENPLGLRGNTPEPLERSVNILTPANVGADPPGPNIQEARNFGQGRTLSLDLAAAGDDRNVIATNTVDEVLAEDGATPQPEAIEEAPFELLIAPAVQPGFVAEPEPIEETEPAPNLPIDEPPEPALIDPADIPGPAGAEVAISSLVDTQQVFEDDREAQAVQAPAFPELDPNEPFIPNPEPEAQEENVPAVAQPPLNIPPPEFENVVAVAPPLPGNVETLDENPQALRRDNLGTDPALRSNRELRSFLQQFNSRIEPPEAVTEDEGGPITEVQNNAPPPPAVLENLEAVRAELLNDLREEEAPEGVTRPEEERTAPPEPRTPQSLLTQRGQNIDQFI
jgi:hypothetical protein